MFLRHPSTRRWIAGAARLQSRAIKAQKERPVIVGSCNQLQRQSFMSTDASSTGEKYEFKAETSKILDIVTNSIYTDKEIFLRELVSNAADALEKFRHVHTKGETVENADRDLAIKLTTDKEKGTLTLYDSGIGMTKDEMLENLGTIAKSGSKAFVQAQEEGEDVVKNVIGQFGVGFYSAFMVADQVTVTSKSALGGVAHEWVSKGSDDFSIREVPEYTEPGTRIVIQLKDSQKEEYTNPSNITGIVKKYSNYVGFPVFVDENQANEVSAIWSRDKSQVSEEEYEEFYRFHTHSFDKPLYRLHFRADVPIDMKALVFVPTMNPEKIGMERAKPGVSLYSRKVLLEQHSPNLLPDWLRFVKGVVDSEDLPISLSREGMQDSRLLLGIKKAVTRKVIKMLQDEAKRNAKTYNEKFAHEFGMFLKEGVCTDFENQRDVAKLLRFGSSETPKGELTSLDEYISRCSPSQDKIYYLSAPSRELAEASPYYEVFKENNIEVLFLYHSIDDFVMSNLGNYQERELVSAEAGNVDLQNKEQDKDSETKDGEDSDKTTGSKAQGLEPEQIKELSEWIKTELKDSIREVSPSTRLASSPAIVVDHESASLRRMMKMVNQTKDGSSEMQLAQQHLEINTKHPIVISLNELRNSDPTLARSLAQQLFDNALIAAGLVDDPRVMLPRLNKLLETLLEESGKNANK